MKIVFSFFAFFVCAFFFYLHSAFAEPKPLLTEKDGQLISDFFQVWSQNGSNVNLMPLMLAKIVDITHSDSSIDSLKSYEESFL